MKTLKIMLMTGLCGLLFYACRQQPSTLAESSVMKEMTARRIKLPNGWSLTPAGNSISLTNDLPLNLVVSPSRKLLAVTNNGQSTQSIALIDVETEKVLDNVVIPKSYVGLAFSPDEKNIYASGGNDNKVVTYQIDNQKLVKKSEIMLGKPTPNRISPTGLCIDAAGQRLYVVTKDDSSLYTCDLVEQKVLKKTKLKAEAYTCMLSGDGKSLFISMWGGASIAIYNTESEQLTAQISTDKNPNDMVLSKNGTRLFVANGNDNTVSVIDVKNQKLIETLTTSLYANAPVGSTPNGVALNDDNTKLYIVNADNNCLAVFDVSEVGKSRSLGFIPTGWYPTSVKVIGEKIYVTNGKGLTSLPNPKGPQPVKRGASQDRGANPEANSRQDYIGGLFKGTLSIIKTPDEPTLAAYSQLVYQNSPYTKAKENLAEGESGNPIPMKVGAKSPIKYVFYIIKENRTYDQILGDVKEGNGDASLCLFPEKVTPNLHALAKEFVLLDNFYVDAEVSADGHNWSTAAYANDYVEKNWVTSYGGRGGSYDFEGQRGIAYPRDGFIWEHCQRTGVSYRTYGEFSDGGKANIKALEGHFCKKYRGFDMQFPDIQRQKIWETEFDSLLAANAVPHFNTIRFSNDHTSGARLGTPTPEAAVADNDLAVGRFVEHLSKSSIWKESVVFILEDDAQNGPDHVDAHRSPAYVAGGFVKRGFVDHTMYSTSGILRTMELVLGLKPMSQYDAAAVPLWKCFAKENNPTPFNAKAPNIDLGEKNVAVNSNSRKSARFNFTIMDAAPDLALNEIVWQTVKGQKSKMPAPRRSAFVKLAVGKEEDDD